MRNKTLLLVDDHDEIRSTLRYLIESEFPGLNILEAENGREAIEVLKSKKVDLYFLDLRMPGMSGAEMIAAIKGNPKLAAIPFYVTTAVTPSELNVFPSGIRVIKKPFEFETIFKAIRATLGI